MLRSRDYRREEVRRQRILARAFRRKFQQRCGFFELARAACLRLIYYRNLVCKILEGVCWGREVNGLTLSVLKSKDLLGCGRTEKNCDSWRIQH